MELSQEDKIREINIMVTKSYPKMQEDFKKITSYNSKMYEDLLPFCISELLSKKSIDYQYQLICVDKKLANYIGRSMSLNIRSNTSPYWSHYRRESYSSRGVYLTDNEREADYQPDDFDLELHEQNPRECLHYSIEKLDFYHKAIITDYYLNDMTYNEMHSKYGITLASLKKAVNTAIKLIQKDCKQFIK
jgi:DNA-directed RNA polymerase specialized sigma subunit